MSVPHAIPENTRAPVGASRQRTPPTRITIVTLAYLLGAAIGEVGAEDAERAELAAQARRLIGDGSELAGGGKKGLPMAGRTDRTTVSEADR